MDRDPAKRTWPWPLMALVLALVVGVTTPVFGQYVGTAKYRGVMTDFYRVSLGQHAGPHLTPPHPKWIEAGEPPPTIPQMARLHKIHRALDSPRRPAQAPTIGTVQAICLLVDFSDRPAGNIAGIPATRQSYIDMLFTTGVYATGSMREYYLEDSYGMLDIQGTVANGTGGAVAGWFRAPQTHAYYCANQQGLGPYKAVPPGPGGASNAQELVEDAIALADPIVNFANYASGGPGTMVDILYVVHAGTSSQLSGLTTDIATHMWQTPNPVNVDGVFCQSYAMEAEDDMVGGFAHETGHLLGAPDLYDYDVTAFINRWDDNDYPVTEWCIMGMGSWGGPGANGTCPSHHCGWIKCFVYGWLGMTPITPAQGSQVIPVTDVQTNNSPTSLYEVQISPTEFFYIENRYSANPAITFDKWSMWPQPPVAKRDGVIIYHWDMLGPTGGGRLNDAWPTNKDYFLWVEDAGMVPAPPPFQATWTAAPLQEGKAHAAFRSDGIGRMSKTNANNPVLILGVTPENMYPETCDNQAVMSNIEWIDVLSTPGPAMNIRVQFSPIAMTFGVATKGITTLGPGNKAQVDYYNLNVLQSAFVDDANFAQVNADPGSTYTYQNLSTGSGTTHQWQADPAQATGMIPGAPQTISCNFYEQWQATVTLNGTDATYTASHVARTLLGQNALLSGLYNVWQGWCDAGTPLTFSGQTAGSPPRPAVGRRSWTMNAAKTVTVNYDAANPTVTITNPPNNDVFWGGPTGPNQAITGTASDDVALRRVDVSLNGGAWQLATGTTSWTVNVTLAPGRNQITARAKDKAGKVDYDTISLGYDTTAPSVTFRSPSVKTAYRGPSVTVRGLATDDVGLKRVAIRIGTTSPWTDLYTGPPFARRKAWSHTLTLSAGANLVQVRAWDRSRRATTTSLTLYYDTQRPAVAITQPTARARVNRPNITVKGTASDNIGLKTVHLNVNGGAWQVAWSGSWRKSINWNGTVTLVSGRNVIRAKATDMSGRTTLASCAVFLVSTTAADGVAATETLMVSAVAAQPTKAGGASCSFVLSAPATVRAEVLNLAGRPVAVVARDKACGDGLNTLVWSGQAVNGLPAPDGIYILSIEATSATGACARALSRVSIQR